MTDEQAIQAAEDAGLIYTSDAVQGISRQRRGSGFAYYDLSGRHIRDALSRKRLKALAVPPAWSEVWICPLPSGHLQATGRDSRGRKQYVYHARWREARDTSKFHNLARFGQTLPSLRRQVLCDLSGPGLTREKMIAVAINILDRTGIRIGNEGYSRMNGTYGLSTLMQRHVDVVGTAIRFKYPGKGGKVHELTLKDRRLARILRRSSDLPGQELFQYVDDDGTQASLTSTDINQRLREITGEDFTAKDIRTWCASATALAELLDPGEAGVQKELEKKVLAACDAAAEQLGNSRAVCRRSYIYPPILESYIQGTLLHDELLDAMAEGTELLAPQEVALLALMKREAVAGRPAAVGKRATAR